MIIKQTTVAFADPQMSNEITQKLLTTTQLGVILILNCIPDLKRYAKNRHYFRR